MLKDKKAYKIHNICIIMEFESAYKITEELIRNDREDVFVRKKDIEKLVETDEEYKILYFLRKSNYIAFHDFPCCGAFRKELTSSFIEGPFASAPETKKSGEYDEYSEEAIQKFIPANALPKSFEEIEKIRYGTRLDEELMSFAIGRHGEIKEKIREVGESALKKLREITQVEEGNLYFYFSGNGFLGHLYLSDERSYYPAALISILGKKKSNPDKIIRELGLYELDNAFKDSIAGDCGIENCTQRGLAYNLELSPDLRKALESDRIIL